jgi:integrase
MPAESHAIMDGKVHVYRRENSRRWQCAVYLAGRNHRETTGSDNLAFAVDFARGWYLERLADDRLQRRGIPLPGAEQRLEADVVPAAPPREKKKAKRTKKKKGDVPTFNEAADVFLGEYRVLTQGERNAEHVAQKERSLRLYIRPFLAGKTVDEVDAGVVQEYRVHRLSAPPDPTILRGPRGVKFARQRRTFKLPSRSTLDKEIIVIRQVLKTANRKRWIAAVPDLAAPYKSSRKVSHRAWFSPEDYKRFYTATRERARNPLKERWRHECEQFHDWVLFMANTGLRPDEASNLQYRDVSIILDEATNERILQIEVRGKRGVGFCKSMPGAVHPFIRLRKRNNPEPTDIIFGPVQRELLNAVLDELDLKTDREGNARTAYSLRHTYISMRLMEGADIYQIAKNCRTSVEMIEKFYASHIANTSDAAAINVRRQPVPRKIASAAKALAEA